MPQPVDAEQSGKNCKHWADCQNNDGNVVLQVLLYSLKQAISASHSKFHRQPN